MHLALAAFKLAVPCFGERPLTPDDFGVACLRTRVAAHSIPLRVEGFYMFTRRRSHLRQQSTSRPALALRRLA